MSAWIERYLAGEHAEVWAEMTNGGEGLRQDADWADAVAVARETMRRARSNVERLVELLPAAGFEFDRPPGAVHVPPGPTVAADIERLERAVGVLPLSLRCWYQQVGHVNLVGRNPRWGLELTDPLVVNAPIDFVIAEHDQWLHDRGTEWDQGPFVVEFAPDALHKANVSGGPAYAIAVPDAGADGPVLWEPHRTTFVDYLRVAFRWAGLPGWDPAVGLGGSPSIGGFPVELGRIAGELMPL